MTIEATRNRAALFESYKFKPGDLVRLKGKSDYRTFSGVILEQMIFSGDARPFYQVSVICDSGRLIIVCCEFEIEPAEEKK